MALIFGNGAYRNAPQLDNPSNDAEDIAKSLQAVGFDVVLRRDATRADMTEAMRDFSERIRGADVALFYYAGHGLQMEGENYLLPVDAKIETPADVRFNTINLNDVQEEMNGSRARQHHHPRRLPQQSVRRQAAGTRPRGRRARARPRGGDAASAR